MSYIFRCKSCENNQICKLKDDDCFIALCPRNKSRSVIETKQIKHAKQFQLKNPHPDKRIQEREKERELEKRRILKDIEKGRGGPDIAGLKRMHGTVFESKLAKKAKERLVNSF